MISTRISKLIRSLAHKKKRDELGLFIAEGPKLVQDLGSSFSCQILLFTSDYQNNCLHIKSDEQVEVSMVELQKLSNQQHPQGVLAVFKKPKFEIDIHFLSTSLSIVLEDVQDPGNLGTIIRVADWFGIKDLICSEYTADAYSPKAVQSSMGALARVRVHYVCLHPFLKACNRQGLPIYGTFMNGNNIYNTPLTNRGIIVMGNEGNGISDEIGNLVTERILIPNYPLGETSSESLNVGVATALVCAEFRRR
jgi:TrmH family RNA methyltransferase